MNSVQSGNQDDKGEDKEKDEDIGGSSSDEKNWKGIVIAILVIFMVLGMIACAIVIVSPADTGPRVKGERMKLDQILDDEFVVNEFNGTWMSGNEFVFRDASGGLSIFSAANLSSRMLVPSVTFKQLNVDIFNVSADLKFVLFSEKVATLHSYSFTARYYIYEVSTMHAKPLTHRPDTRGHPALVYAKFGPHGSALLMVDRNFNIFYKQYSSSEEVFQITNNGLAGVIHNGAPDWVYETEIFGDRYASWFAPDGNSLAYATFNDSMVDEVPIIHYGLDKQYPTITQLRYSKAGQMNPRVTMWIADLTSDLTEPKVRDVKPPDGVKEQLVTSSLWDHYFTALTWVDNEILSIVWMNRAQNVSVITICKPPLYFCEATHTETAHHGWVDVYQAPIFSSDGQAFLVRLPVRNGDQGEFTHVNLYNMTLRMVNPMTHGSYEVTEILGWNHESNYIFFMGTTSENPGHRHLYRIPALISAVADPPECMSCFYPMNTTEKCFYNKAHMSKDFSYFILECLGPAMPSTYLYSTWNLSERYLLNNYDELRTLLTGTALPEIKTFKVELEGETTFTAHVQLLLPPGLREDEITTYPMVVRAHGNPGYQSVDSKMKFNNYGTYLASKKDIIYAVIDGRGSGFQGDNRKHETFLNLGHKEVMDQLAVISYLKNNLKFIDDTRIVIWGWNYGGFVTTMAMAKDANDMLCCGIAVAPITRWEHYDSIFTERYMGSPHVHPGSNYKGYEAADVTKVAGNFKSSKFLLIHGTADRDVHFHHSMMLAKSLTREGVIFRQISYPDEGNSLEGVKEHLYRSIDNFLSDCFRPSIEELYFHLQKKKDLEELGYL